MWMAHSIKGIRPKYHNQRIRIKTHDNDHYHEELSELYVTTLGDNDIIFGTDWLHDTTQRSIGPYHK